VQAYAGKFDSLSESPVVLTYTYIENRWCNDAVVQRAQTSATNIECKLVF